VLSGPSHLHRRCNVFRQNLELARSLTIVENDSDRGELARYLQGSLWGRVVPRQRWKQIVPKKIRAPKFDELAVIGVREKVYPGQFLVQRINFWSQRIFFGIQRINFGIQRIISEVQRIKFRFFANIFCLRAHTTQITGRSLGCSNVDPGHFLIRDRDPGCQRRS
jgi:hypothetical protein